MAITVSGNDFASLYCGASMELLLIGKVEYYRTLKMAPNCTIYWSRWHKLPENDRRRWQLVNLKRADAIYTARAVAAATRKEKR